MHGLDDSEPEENDGIRVNGGEGRRGNTGEHEGERTVGKRACDEVKRTREKDIYGCRR